MPLLSSLYSREGGVGWVKIVGCSRETREQRAVETEVYRGSRCNQEQPRGGVGVCGAANADSALVRMAANSMIGPSNRCARGVKTQDLSAGTTIGHASYQHICLHA